MSQATDGLPQSPEAWLAWGSRILQTQAFSVLLGAKLTALDRGSCELTLPLSSQHFQQHGFAHGGVVSYLADNALTYAGGTSLGSNALTLEFKINYVRPAIGEVLIARAQAEATGKTQSVCRCNVYAVKDGEEKLCAVAQGTIVPAPSKD
ncbi:MAG: PaaI family thioesterase [Brachymonas sp.]